MQTPILQQPIAASTTRSSFRAAAISSALELLRTKFHPVSVPISRVQEKANSSHHDELRHAHVKLDSRHYKTTSFVSRLLECCRTLNVPRWSNNELAQDHVVVHKVSGSLTNAVFFVSCPTIRHAPTLLLRIYGPSSGILISRSEELHTLHVLSSQFGIGPRVYGTFDNGRIEEYFDSTTLTPSDIRNPKISRWIGARMAELHSVDMSSVETSSGKYCTTGETSVQKNITAWLGSAQAVLALPAVSQAIKRALDLERFRDEWDKYMRWLSKVDDMNNGGQRVFAHNDAQYGNLLKLKRVERGLEEHHQIIVVDFEYAGPNAAAYDIANHFHEWTADYHSLTPHLLDLSKYPSIKERRNFYLAYLKQCRSSVEDLDGQASITKLDEQVRYWSPASHAMWAIWGIVQAREDVEGNVEQPEFDYISYAVCRMAAFRRELRALVL
ncbi:hypothetical protein APHAL10511_006503 [Amanita phalloides]|nr:hypothetical protein APHAL10511_006503 [Amanita phalloides]